MRILYLVQQYPPQYTTGTEILTHETAKAQLAAGHDVEVLAAELVDAPAKAADQRAQGGVWEGVPVHRYPYFQPMPAPGVDPFRAEYANARLQQVLAARIAAFRPDVVHAFHLYRISATAVDTVHAAGIPMVFAITDFWPVCQAINLRLADGSVCPGPDRNSFNCMRHLGGGRVPAWGRFIPAAAMELGARAIRWRRRGATEFQPLDYAASLALRQSYLRARLRRIDAVVVPSRTVRDRVANLGISRRRMHHLPFGLNLDYLRDAPAKAPSARLRVGFIGTLSQPKGLHVLVQALKDLPAELPIELRIHGRFTDDPAYAERMQALLAGDPRATFLGAFPNHRIGEVLSQIDVLVVPSVWLENTPLVISSAQAARTPVIATDLGGMSESITHDHNGLLFPVADAGALAACLRRLITEPGLLQRLAGNARPPRSIAEYAGDLLGIYRQVTAKA